MCSESADTILLEAAVANEGMWQSWKLTQVFRLHALNLTEHGQSPGFRGVRESQGPPDLLNWHLYGGGVWK